MSFVPIDAVYELPISSPWYESTRFFVGAVGGGIYASLTTGDFDVRHRDGKAEVTLNRQMTIEQAREMARAVLAKCDEMEAQAASWVVVTNSCAGGGGDPAGAASGAHGIGSIVRQTHHPFQPKRDDEAKK